MNSPNEVVLGKRLVSRITVDYDDHLYLVPEFRILPET